MMVEEWAKGLDADEHTKSEMKKLNKRDLTKIIKAVMKLEQHSPHDEESAEKKRWNDMYEGMEFIDDVHGGKVLNKDMVIQARRLEMDFFKKMKVYKKVPKAEAKGHKIISTRWVDTNKGDEVNPDYRSRLVGKELKKDSRLDLFAATPPLETMKILIAKCAQGQGGA